MGDNFVYCQEDCDYTKCVRNRKRAGSNAICISSEQFIGCHVRSYSKKPETSGGIRYMSVNDGTQRRV